MGHEALEPLIRLVNSGSPESRYWGAMALGYLGMSEALPALTACVARSDGETADEVRTRKAATKYYSCTYAASASTTPRRL